MISSSKEIGENVCTVCFASVFSERSTYVCKYFVGVVVASLTGNQKASGSIPWRGKNLFHVSLLSLSLRIEKKFKLGDDTFDRVAVLLHMPNKDKHSFIHSFTHHMHQFRSI